MAVLGAPGVRARAQEAGTSVVQTPLGQLRGSVLPDGIRVFRGVPFAEAPVGRLRWMPTEPKRPWTGVRDATRFGPAAMQEGDRAVAQSEDCLFLNVWAPAQAAAAKPCPVFVWIHGGGFTGGNAFAPIFDGEGFARQGIVLVTVAYRLGVFGFLDMESLLGAAYRSSGNNGMRDLVESLRWVRSNIAAFGGDPDRVTVGGESAGAKATAALLALPEAQPLFHSAISESGGGERVLTLRAATDVATMYGDLWRRTQPTTTSGFEDLRAASAASLIEVQRQLLATSSLHFPFRSEVDGVYLKARPVDLVGRGSSRGKRLLIGSNRDESALFLGPHPQQDPTSRDLGNLALAQFTPVLQRYAGVYPGMTAEQLRVRAVTAEEYWVPTVRLAEAHVQNGGTAWMYELDFSRPGGRYPGEAYHSEDLAFVWDREAEVGAGGERLAQQMHAAWAAFVRGEAPSAAGLPTWPQYNAAERPTMILDRTSHVETRPQERELRLWDGLL